jgi:hypothetical protein
MTIPYAFLDKRDRDFKNEQSLKPFLPIKKTSAVMGVPFHDGCGHIEPLPLQIEFTAAREHNVRCPA